MKLRYTSRAAAELDEALTHIAKHSPQGGRRVQARIQAAIELLSRYPLAGQMTSKGLCGACKPLPIPI